jgi:hypothetical protein
MSTLLADLRLAFRSMRKSPAITLVVVLTLAVGIGANGAIFSVINGVLLQPLEYPEPHKLVHITSKFLGQGFERFWISPPEFLEYEDWNESYTAMGAYRAFEVGIQGNDRPLRVRGAVASAGLFDALGVGAVLGRVFNHEEDVPNGPPAAVISNNLWFSAFAGSRGLLDEPVNIHGQPTTIVGVMPPGFDIEENQVQVWTPLGFGEEDMGWRANHFLFLVARLKDDATVQSARAELGVLTENWNERSGGAGHTPSVDNHPLQINALHEEIVGNT